MQQSCQAGQGEPCTRFDCKGAYKYSAANSYIPLENSIEVDYCFGLVLNHCDEPLSLDFYVQVPARNITVQQRITHDTHLPISGLKYRLKLLVTAEGFLYFEMGRIGDQVKFSVTVKVKITSSGTVTWPPSLQRKIISNETIPVPPCTAGEQKMSPPLVLSTCNPPHWKILSKGFQYCDSQSYNKSCNTPVGCNGPAFTCNKETLFCECADNFVFSNGSCCSLSQFGSSCRSNDDCAEELHEICVERNCSCASHYHRDNKKLMCVASKETVSSSSSAASGVTRKPSGSTFTPTLHKQPTSSSKAPVVIGAVLGGLLVLAGVLTAGYFAIRRLRLTYHRRDLLMENEDSDGFI
ncbi:uncharacterized protein LOC112558170 isoform X2 [Pomacea canaliculata]|nr:uncharacterized protein LOC112558170 isoform X2 [Pomacea canaliculata]